MTLIQPTSLVDGDTPSSTGAEGFLLLTITNATLTSTSQHHHPLLNGLPLTGLLSLECVTISVADPMEHDVWLVMRVEPAPPKAINANANATQTPFEFPLPSTQKIIYSRQNQRYTMPLDGGGGGELVLTLPSPKDAAQREDLETFEVILAQYAVLQTQEDTPTSPPGSRGVPLTPPFTTTTPPTSSGSGIDADAEADLKGRLVLVDEDDGQVVGMLDDHFNIREDAAMHVEGNEKHPVVVEIPADEDGSGTGTSRVKCDIFVHTIPVDDSDWISQTAGFLGRGVILATNALSTGVTHTTNAYISYTKPSPTPIQFSENTRKNIKRIHSISGQAVKVTSKTTGLIHQAVERLADVVSGGTPAVTGTSSRSKHGLGNILRPHGGGGSSSRTPSGRNSPSSSPCMMGEGGANFSKEWSTPYAGAGQSSAASIHSGPPPSYIPSLQPTPPPRRRRLLNRLLTSTDLLLTTVESSATHLITHTTTSLSAAARHKYGDDMGSAVGVVGESVRNVGVVYVDARGVGRRALLRVAAGRVVRARMGGREVVFKEGGLGRGVVLQGDGVGGGGVGGGGVGSQLGSGSGHSGYGPPSFPPPGAAMPGSYSNSKLD